MSSGGRSATFPSRRGQAEVLDSVLLIGVIVIGVSIVGTALIMDQQARGDSLRTPTEVRGSVENSWATVTHTGGRPIPLSDLDLLIRGSTNTTRYDLDDPSVTLSDDGDTLFEGAETVNVSHSYTGPVELLLIDTAEPSRVLYRETFTVPTTGGGPTDEIAIERFEVNDTSTTDDATYNITWQATDPGDDISSATINLIDQETGAVVDTQTYTFTSTGDTGNQTARLENASGSGRVYILNLTVEDAAGDTKTVTRVDTADSEFGLRDPVIQSFDVTDTTSGNTASYEATYNVSDPDADLHEVNVTLVNADTGTVVDNVTDVYNDTSATGLQTRTLSAGKGSKKQTFYINITATDLNSRTAVESVTDTADGGGGGGGGATAPTFQTFDATDQSSCSQKQTEYVIDWNVTDDQDNLDSVVVELLDSKGKQVVVQSYDVSGGQAANTTMLTLNSNKIKCNDSVTVKITATDTTGNTASESWTDTVDGSGTN